MAYTTSFDVNRRDFLKTAALASCALLTPNFLSALNSRRLLGPRANGRVLVVVQLSGGNDGLNMVVPYRNDDYYRFRPKIGIPAKEVIHLNDSLGLNPAMTGLGNCYDRGQLTILSSVGYPNPNRSHFRSIDIWQTGSDADQYLTTGWLGRYLDSACPTRDILQSDCPPYALIEMDDTLSLATKGARHSGFGVRNPGALYQSSTYGVAHDLQSEGAQGNANGRAAAELDFLYKTTTNAVQSARIINDAAQKHKPKTEFPNNEFGRDLKLVAGLIQADLDTSVYYVSLAGFDTHVNQVGRHKTQLSQLAEGLDAFMQELHAAGRDKDVAVVAFSEFGRRVQENASGGTDHGCANTVLLLGGALKSPGCFNPAPDLANLTDGDVQYKLDFRSIYATLLRDWLEADDEAILGRRFDRLSLV